MSLDGVDISDLLQEMEGVIKIACMQLLNKLGQIVRATTNNFWIRSVNLRDIFNFRILERDSWQFLNSVDFSQGYYFPKLKMLQFNGLATDRHVFGCKILTAKCRKHLLKCWPKHRCDLWL